AGAAQMEPGSEAEEVIAPRPAPRGRKATQQASEPEPEHTEEPVAEHSPENTRHAKLAIVVLILVIAGLVAHWRYGPYMPSLPIPNFPSPNGNEMTIAPLSDALPEAAITSPEPPAVAERSADPQPVETTTFHEGEGNGDTISHPEGSVPSPSGLAVEFPKDA